MIIDEGQDIRFKVVEEAFIDISPNSESRYFTVIIILLKFSVVSHSKGSGETTSELNSKDSPYTVYVRNVIMLLNLLHTLIL